MQKAFFKHALGRFYCLRAALIALIMYIGKRNGVVYAQCLRGKIRNWHNKEIIFSSHHLEPSPYLC